MPRRARVVLPDVPLHFIRPGKYRQSRFFAEDGCHVCFGLPAELAPRCDCRLYAWVLRNNHAHLLLMPAAADSAGRLMKALDSNGEKHRSAGREPFRRDLDAGLIDEFRSATNGNFAPGSAAFGDQATAARGHRAGRAAPGRPPKFARPDAGDPSESTEAAICQ